MKRFFIGTLLALAITAQAQLDSLEHYLLEGMERFDQVGMNVAVYKDGALAYSGSFGYADKQKEQALELESVFAVASVSKAFTAAAIGLLVDEGLLNWDDRVVDHWPGFQMHDPYVTREMRVLDLLCHRNGYNTFDGDLLWYGTAGKYNRREILERFKALPPKHGFRNAYGYQNTMFIAAAILIEEVSGLSWEDFVQQRIFTPLGMNNSFSHVKDARKAGKKALPHIKGKSHEMQDYTNAAGAVGVHTHVLDMQPWLNMWMNAGMHGEEAFLKENTVRTILQAHTSMGVSKGAEASGTHFSAAALGWFVKDQYGKKIISHSGGLPGYILNVVMVPEEELAVVVFTNDETILPFAVSNYVIEAYLTGDAQDWVGQYGNYHDSRKEAAKKEEASRMEEKDKRKKAHFSLKDALGVYTDAMYGNANIKEVDGQFVLTLEPTDQWFTSSLEHWTGNTFRVQFKDPFLPDGFVTFELDSHGQVLGFKIDLPNPDFHFYNLDFQKQQ